jgi:hypothetical protein
MCYALKQKLDYLITANRSNKPRIKIDNIND